MSTPFKMKGFSGFGNSPAKDKGHGMDDKPHTHIGSMPEPQYPDEDKKKKTKTKTKPVLGNIEKIQKKKKEGKKLTKSERRQLNEYRIHVTEQK